MSEPEAQDSEPTAFVIMPFGEDLDVIYTDFIRRTLRDAGFEVSRADDLQNSQNIMKTIIQSIGTSDLIVADLTDSNPNVYYELGVAHTLNKAVILLTQDIDDLPFDIRSYSTIQYTNHFADIARARDELLDRARGFLSGSSEFGSPISDSLGVPVEAFLQKSKDNDGASGVPDATDEAGILDHLSDLELGVEKLEECIVNIGLKTNEVSQETVNITNQINSVDNRTDRSSARQSRVLVIKFAKILDDYAKFLAENSTKYRAALKVIEKPLEVVARSHTSTTDDEREKLKEFLSSLDGAESGLEKLLSSIYKVKVVWQDISNVERNLNRAKSASVREIGVLAGNLEQTKAMLNRAKQIGYEELDKSLL